MAKKVNLKINGVDITATEGMNLIEAAALGGIHIPNLCYIKGMKGVGACRLCLAEVEGGRGPVIACNTKVKDGMVVNTNTESILEQRKFVIDLILSMHPLDCMTCTKAGICRLQSYSYDFGIKESSFNLKRFGHPTDEGNPFIKLDPDYCILCGRCVRVCKEQGTNVLEFMGRGVGSKVATAVDKPLQESSCTFCGSCLDACPVNAILEADRWRKGREWDYAKAETTCLICGDACSITASSKDGSVMKVNSSGDDTKTKYICAYGRFGYDSLISETRALSPMVRQGGKLKEASWDEALKAAAAGLKKAGKDAGVISTASITNEDALALKALADGVVKTKNYDTTVGLYADAESLANSGSASLADADLIVAVGIDPSQWQRALPALDASIRRSVARGAKLVVINSGQTGLDDTATAKLDGKETDSIKALINEAVKKGAKADKALQSAVSGAKGSEEAEKAGELLAGATSPLVISSPALFDAASNIALLKGEAVSVAYESNARGVTMMGLKGKGKAYKEMVSEGSKALLVVGTPPIKKKPATDFLVVQAPHLTGIAKQADVFLPAAAYLESSGTIVDYMGQLKTLCAIVEPAGDSMENTEIIAKLAKAMKGTLNKPTASAVKTKAKAKAKRSLKPFDKQKGLDVAPDMIVESLNEPVMGTPRLVWLKESVKAAAKV